jgi:hypothetical protein
MHGAFMDMTLHQPPVAPALGYVMLIGSILPLVMVAKCLCDYLENYYMTWVSLKVLHDLRSQNFQPHPWPVPRFL